MSVLEQFRLDGKVALVTGCKRGIGKAIAVALAEAEADIVGVSASLGANSEVEREIRALGRSFTPYACDFGRREALNGFIKQLNADHEVIDILVNNAGTIKRKPAAEHEDALWDEVLETNLNAQFILGAVLGSVYELSVQRDRKLV
jgi:2-deoxy-D-gluconate 3-dehydrogenase